MIERWRLVGYVLFAGLLVAQAAFSVTHPRAWRAELSPGRLPDATTLRLSALGESEALANGLSLRLQAFDAQAGHTVAMRTLDGPSIRQWLDRIAELAPQSRYPTFMASRIYATTQPKDEARKFLLWLDTRYPVYPEAHWAWQAFGVYVAEHRLGDKLLARDMAHNLRIHADGTSVPQWARDLEFFLLTELNEVEAAQTLLGGLIDAGQLSDKRALQAMLITLEEAERQLNPDARATQQMRDKLNSVSDSPIEADSPSPRLK